MEIAFDGSTVRSTTRAAVAFLVAVLRRLYERCRSVAAAVASWTAWTVRWGIERTRRSVGTAASTADEPSVRRLVRRLWHGVVGRRFDVSVGVVLLAPLLALATNYWAVGVGYPRIERWVRGTWDGTDPQTAVFLVVGALVVLAAASAAVNSGLVPTTLLVAGPVFGVAFTRYGTTVEGYGTVGIPDAVGVGLLCAVAFGVPIACAGFGLGTVARRTATALRGRGGGTSVVERR